MVFYDYASVWDTIRAALLLLVAIVIAAIFHAAYNVFLHHLRAVPGPKLWAATRIPWCWYQYRGTLHCKLLNLHLRFGSAVRVAPNEISFTTNTAWKTIYGQRAVEMQKDPIFSLLTPTGAQNILVADRETHTRQRRLLSHAFSEKALREQESILQLHTNKLLDQLSHRCGHGPINIVAWLNFLTFDLIGDMAFGEGFQCLDRGEYDPFVEAISAMATELTFNQMWKYWGLSSVRKYFMSKKIAGKRVTNIRRAMSTVAKRMQRETNRKDFMHYILSATEEKGMSPDEIHVNAFSLSIAGSESTATALCGAVFFACTHTGIYSRLVAEIRDAFRTEADITIASTRDLEYLEAIISETIRLYPPVAISQPRRTPRGGEAIDGITVGEEVTVGVHHYSSYRSPSNFYRPDDFLPERWLLSHREAAPFASDNRDSFQPFSFGPRNCLGKNLARAEMRLTLAKLLFRFDLELVPDQGHWCTSQKLHGFWQKQPLYCALDIVHRVDQH